MKEIITQREVWLHLSREQAEYLTKRLQNFLEKHPCKIGLDLGFTEEGRPDPHTVTKIQIEEIWED